MRGLGLWAVSVLSILSTVIAGCGGDSHMGEVDAEIMFDARVPDAGPDSGPPPIDAFMPPVPVCGNRMLEAGEACDDGNTTSGDGCTGMCRREAFCGDDNTDAGEVCDDGNNRSGDGCRADCLSDETCGNNIRDTARGELCDDGNTLDGDGCSMDCRILESCGNGMIDTGETCDDANIVAFDGCGPDCLDEVAVVFDTMEIGGRTDGCDYSGDGEPDNRLALALGGATGFLNPMIEDAIIAGDIIMLLQFLGLDDASGVMDPSLRVAMMQGVDADMDPKNNLTGMGTFLADPGSFDMDGNPTTSLESRIAARMLTGGPEDMEVPIGLPIPLELRLGHINGTTVGAMDGITEGMLCGVAPVDTFALLPNLIRMFMDLPPPCNMPDEPDNFADLMIAGADIFGIGIGPAQPDVDLDGDGLESFETDDTDEMGTRDCQAVVVACIDGDGTRVEGRNCQSDARFADGFSAGLPFSAVGATITGIAP